MSAFIPNTLVTILDTPAGTTAVDDLGDEVADWVPVAEGLPALWVQRNQRTFDPVSQRVTILRGHHVVLRPGTAVTENQRIKNERTGEVGQVNTVDRSAGQLALAGDVVLRVLAVDR